MRTSLRPLVVLAMLLCALSDARAASGDAVRRRLDEEARSGRPLVAHVVVALADNETQGIVPVPKRLGNGRDPAGNVYWGAAYGVRTWFARAGWKAHRVDERPAGVLERVAFRKDIRRGGRAAAAWIVADAWEGARIREAIETWFEYSAGRRAQSLALAGAAEPLAAGGAAPLVVFVGHDGLMDFDIAPPAAAAQDAPPRSAAALACASKQYFGPLLERTGAHRLLLTTNLMAPEAYTLEAALLAWFEGGDAARVRESAAAAYHKYQRCGMKGARRLFAADP